MQQAGHYGVGPAETQAFALGRAETCACQRRRWLQSSGIGSLIQPAKPTVTKVVMSATEKCEPATNSRSAHHGDPALRELTRRTYGLWET